MRSRSFIGLLSIAAAAFIELPVHAGADIESWGAPYETIVLHSSHVKEDFEINILVPDACATKKCPTIYGVDDDLFFGSMTGALYTLKSAGGPSAILVSIGYKRNGVSTEWGRKRFRDLFYLSEAENSKLREFRGEKLFNEKEGAGRGAESFLRFLTQELIPHIESHYQADKRDRTYVGYSGGSLFGLYVLGTSPETFNRYVLGSAFRPSLLQRLEDRLQKSKELNVKLYVGVGLDEPFDRTLSTFGSEMISGYYDLVGLLNRQKIPGFEYHYQEFPDEVHGTAWWLIFAKGLRWAFLGGASHIFLQNKDVRRQQVLSCPRNSHHICTFAKPATH